jgi:hypothetical protein
MFHPKSIEQFSIKFGIWDPYKILSGEFNFDLSRPKTTANLSKSKI